MAFDDQIREVPPGVRDEEVLEEWERATAEPAVGGVYATKVSATGWTWQVSFGVLEFVRDEPLLGQLVAAIVDELSAVDGVAQVAQDDTEVFVVRGAPGGQDLVRAGSRAVDGLSDRLQDHYVGLRSQAVVLRWPPPHFDEAQINEMRERRERSRQAVKDGMRAFGIRELTPEEAAERRRRQTRKAARPSNLADSGAQEETPDS